MLFAVWQISDFWVWCKLSMPVFEVLYSIRSSHSSYNAATPIYRNLLHLIHHPLSLEKQETAHGFIERQCEAHQPNTMRKPPRSSAEMAAFKNCTPHTLYFFFLTNTNRLTLRWNTGWSNPTDIHTHRQQHTWQFHQFSTLLTADRSMSRLTDVHSVFTSKSWLVGWLAADPVIHNTVVQTMPHHMWPTTQYILAKRKENWHT